jgi:hypothetical protein
VAQPQVTASAVAPVRLEQRVESVEGRRVAAGQSPLARRLAGGLDRTIRYESWHGEFSPLGQRRSPEQGRRAAVGGEVSTEAAVLPGTVERETFRRSGEAADIDNLESVTNQGSVPRVERYQRHIDEEILITRERFILGQDAPRMEDINRFVFRKNGTARGEVPVTAAGGRRP